MIQWLYHVLSCLSFLVTVTPRVHYLKLSCRKTTAYLEKYRRRYAAASSAQLVLALNAAWRFFSAAASMIFLFPRQCWRDNPLQDALTDKSHDAGTQYADRGFWRQATLDHRNVDALSTWRACTVHYGNPASEWTLAPWMTLPWARNL